MSAIESGDHHHHHEHEHENEHPHSHDGSCCAGGAEVTNAEKETTAGSNTVADNTSKTD